LLDSLLHRVTGWVPADPVNLLIGAGAGALAFAYLAFAAAHGRASTRWLEAPGPLPEAAIHYEYRDQVGREQKLWPALVAILFWLAGTWDTRRGAFDLWQLAFAGTPTLVFLLLAERRRLRARPAVALYAHGILLDSWRSETTIPWKDIAYVETDPAESTGYRPNSDLRLLIGRKDGRQWRYCERDFGDEAPSRFETIVKRARQHIR
jgi:hypothetical protein